MRRYLIFSVILFLYLFPIKSQTNTAIEDELYQHVVALEGKTTAERGIYIKNQLRNLGLGYITASFKMALPIKTDTIMVEGENILAKIGNGSNRIVVGAHYDVYEGSPAANDNGSGVAVALALINQLIDTAWNYTIDFCFFDQEEKGSLGSQAYVQKFVIPKYHTAMINIDVVGLGDQIFIGPIGDNNKNLIRFIRETIRKTGYPVIEAKDYPTSDFAPFAARNLECISISVLPKGDSEGIIKWVRNNYVPDTDNIPQILGLIHTSYDRALYVSKSSLKMAYEFTKTLLLALNDIEFIPVPQGTVKPKQRKK